MTQTICDELRERGCELSVEITGFESMGSEPPLLAQVRLSSGAETARLSLEPCFKSGQVVGFGLHEGRLEVMDFDYGDLERLLAPANVALSRAEDKRFFGDLMFEIIETVNKQIFERYAEPFLEDFGVKFAPVPKLY